MNDKICILPFNSVSISALGDIRVCCNSGQPLGYNLSSLQSEQDIINNKKIIEIRSDFLQGKENPVCDRCWKIEKFSSHSFRTTANDNFSLKTNQIIKFSETIDFENIQYLDITLGNKCNLACRMCNPNSSSLISKQWTILGHKNLAPELLEFEDKSKERILNLIKKSPNLSHIYMLGGEPLVSEFHNEIVNYLIESNRSKDINLHYSTNLQIDVERKLEEWSHFKMIDLSVSIDGIDETYEYIRWPGKWNKLENNLHTLIEYSKKRTNIMPNVAITVQNLNVDNLYELICRINQIANNNFNFYFIPVTFFNELEIIPKYILEKSILELSKLDHTGIHKLPDLKKLIMSAVEKNQNLNQEKVSEFFKWQRSYDSLRNQNLFELKPHFKELAQQFKIDLW